MAQPAVPRPHALPVLTVNIPDLLKDLPCWVVWKYTWKETEAAWDKPPLRMRGGYAKSTDPATWGTFAEATSTLAARRSFDGIGFVLNRLTDASKLARLVGIDLDHCRNVTTGEIEPWAQVVIDRFQTYTEISPSGTGIRLFTSADLPPGRRKIGPREMYDSRRYVTVTGQHLAGTPRTIEERQETIDHTHKEWFPRPAELPPDARQRHLPPLDVYDEEILATAFANPINGHDIRQLWEGHWRHKSHSEADLALCSHLAYYVGDDIDRVIDLFSRSALFRAKWNDREKYRVDTARKAIDGMKKFHNWNYSGTNGHGPTIVLGSRNGQATTAEPLHLTDLGNCRRLVARHGADLHYIHPWKSWHVWDGRRWAEDRTGEIVRRVKDTQTACYRDALDHWKELAEMDGTPETKEARKECLKLLTHLFKWEDARAIARSIDLTRSEPDIPALPEQFDRNPFILNVHNGTIDLRKGTLRPHRREDLLSKLAPVDFDATALCPLWLKFLGEIMDGNEDLVGYLQRLVGHALTGDVSEQALWFFYGTGANGKSTFLGTILSLLGDYGLQAVGDLLMAKKNESHPTERADLFGRRFVSTVETEEGRRLAESLMKQLTGGDKVRARKLFRDFFDFDPTHKIILAANHKPVIRGTDHAVWRRVKLVPFTVTIPEEEKDKNLSRKLRGELSGILNWALQGCLDWQRLGLGEPEEIKHATDAYRGEQDTVELFLDACCKRGPEYTAKVSILFDAYKSWSDDHAMTQPKFNEILRSKGFESSRVTDGTFWRGIRVVEGMTPKIVL